MGKLKELAINGLKILALGVLAGNRSARSRMGSPSAINRLCYEARSPRADIVGAWYKHFDGEQWAMSRATPERAYDDRLSTPGAHQDWLWRGLSNDA